MRSSTLAQLSVPAEALATALEAAPDYRVLRRLTAVPGPAFHGDRSKLVSGCALDVETTGLDHRNDRIIELAMCRFLSDREGRIVETGRSWRWVEDPGRPIDAHITALTGLRDADVRGRSINDGEATGMLLDADFVIAHNAMFDRGFVERRLPIATGRPWVCSMADVDWRTLGFEGRSLPHLLLQAGWFYEAHRADVDVLALVRLLGHRVDAGSGTVLAKALAHASLPTWIVEAVGAPFASKDLLKARGYRWNANRRYWWREVADDEIDDEVGWAETDVYGSMGSPRRRLVDWTTRYGATVH